MTEDRGSTVSLLRNPWFYGGMVALLVLMFVVAALTPNIRDPWFWQTDDRGPEALSNSTESVAYAQDDETRPQFNDLYGDLTRHPEQKAVGDTEAPVTITEYLDFECPYCGQFSRTVFPRILRDYVASGKVYYQIRHFPLQDPHPMAVPSALASECAADQGQFWPFKHEVMYHQDQLSSSYLRSMPQRLELDADAYESCLQSGDRLDTVEQELKQGIQRNVRSTPTVFVNDRPLSGVNPYDEYKKRIEQALSEARGE